VGACVCVCVCVCTHTHPHIRYGALRSTPKTLPATNSPNIWRICGRRVRRRAPARPIVCRGIGHGHVTRQTETAAASCVKGVGRRRNFWKVSCILILCGKCTVALTFQKFSPGVGVAGIEEGGSGTELVPVSNSVTVRGSTSAAAVDAVPPPRCCR
jgi:hypothetical protein